MTRRLVWIGLVISLALNVLFVAGAIHARSTAERLSARPEARTERLVERLQLGPDQRRALRTYRSQARERVAAMRAQLRPAFQDMRQQLGADKPDPELLAANLVRMAETRHEFERDMAAMTGQFLQNLEPRQMRRFLDFARRRSWQHAVGLLPSRSRRSGHAHPPRPAP